MHIISLRFFILLMLYAFSYGNEEMVKLKRSNGRPPKTSSTLLWQDSKAGKDLPHHSIPVNAATSEYVWCRAKSNSGILVPGGIVENGTCAFAFYGSSVIYANYYDVLVSDHGSARVKMEAWDSLTSKPKNCLLSPSRVLIAVSDTDNSSYYVAGNIGSKDSDRRAFYPKENTIAKSESGYILVEDEPVSYRLTNITFKNKSQEIYTTQYELNSTQLFNLGGAEKLVSGVVSYVIPKKQYWAKPKGTCTGLPTTVYVNEEDPFEVFWGSETTSKRIEFSSINYKLPPLSGVNVTINGTMETFKAPYDGVLTAIYEDAFSANRPIYAFHIGKVFKRISLLYSSPFYLNGSIIDEPKKSELLYEHTTTTTTTTTTTETQPPTTLVTTTEATTIPVLITGMFSSPLSTTEGPKYLGSSDIWDIRTTDDAVQVDTKFPFDNQGRRNSERVFDDFEDNTVANEELKSTSDRIISVLSTIFTGLVFWYFSLGIAI